MLLTFIWSINVVLDYCRNLIEHHSSFLGKSFASSDKNEGGDIVIVTAHPDDEVMFFTPTIRLLRKIGRRVHLLCLTKGDAGGLGNRRTAELEASAELLGLASVIIHDNPDSLPDSMITRWDREDVANVIQNYLRTNPIVKTIITFDGNGISGHPNHCDTSHGIAQADLDPSHEVWELESSPVWVKYMGVLGVVFEAVDLLLNSLLSESPRGRTLGRPKRVVALISLDEAIVYGYGGMKRHYSQLIWFRYLWLFFSRYLHLNTLRRRI